MFNEIVLTIERNMNAEKWYLKEYKITSVC